MSRAAGARLSPAALRQGSPNVLRPLAEAMEERILHSADLAPLLLGAGVSEQRLLDSAATAPVSSSHATEIAFIDAALPDADGLRADLLAQQAAGRSIEVVTIGAGEDGLALITRTLAERQDLTAVHLLAHGSDGQLQLGSLRLDGQTLLARAAELADWSRALNAGADLLLYGCDLAQDADGQQLVRDIAALTGADVAASTDATGAAARGGNWTLELQTGAIQAALAPSAAEQTQWQGLMATYTVTTTSDVVGPVLLPGSLRWAISQANANGGTDTIVFAVNGSFNMAALSNGDDNNASGDFDITDSVNIIGNGSGNTVINGNGLDRVFDLRNGVVSMSGLTIQGGYSNHGAGIQISTSGALTLTDAVVQNNLSAGNGNGGGIETQGALVMRRVLVQNNGDTVNKLSGAGLYVGSNSQVDVQDVEFRNNNANGGDGGAVYVTGNTNTQFANVTFAGNQAKNGGGVYNNSGGVTIVNSTFSGNSASQKGGGLWSDRYLVMNHVTLALNSATVGAGLLDNKGNGGNGVYVSNSLFASNTGGNSSGLENSQGYNLSDDLSGGFTATGDRSNTAVSLSALASNGGFTRTHAITAGSAARDAANPVTTLSTDQRGVAYSGGRADVGAYEYNTSGNPPTVSPIGAQTINEDTPLAALAFTVSDTETAAGSLVVTASSSNTALVPNGNLVIGGSGSNRSISLTPAANANGSSTITLSVSDGGNVSTSSFVLTVSAVNDAPLIALPGPVSVAQNAALTLAGASAPRFTDVDAGSASVQVTLSATHGLLALNGSAGLSFVTGNAAGSASMTFTGNLTAINTALAGMVYTPSTNYVGADTISFSINDLGNSGSGGAKTTNATLAVTVSAVNQRPTLTVPGAQGTPQPTPLTFSPSTGNAIRVADTDAGSAVVQLSLSTAVLGNGSLNIGALNGATVTAGANSSAALTLQGTLTQLNAALDSLSFTATSASAARIDLVLDDLGNSGSGGALQASQQIAITITAGTNALPVITLPPTPATFVENDAPLAIAAGLTVADADNTTLASARVAISAGYAGAEDVLALSASAGIGNIAVTSNINGVLSLSSASATATLSEWQTALRSVTYSNLSQAPSTAPRTLTFTLNDGIADSAAKNRTLTVTAVNDAPVLTGINALAAIDEDAGSAAATNPGTLVSVLLAGHLNDADADALAGIAVIGVDNAHGSWQYTTDAGNSWLNFNSSSPVSPVSARLLAADALSAVRFVPAADWNGSVTSGLTLRAWDQTSGSAGGTADASSGGGSLAFSSANFAASVTINAINDAPVAAGNAALAAVPEDAVAPAGATVASLFGANFSDAADAGALGPHQLAGVAVVGQAALPNQGRWEFSNDGGVSWTGFGSPSDTRALTLEASDRLRFLPGSNYNGTPGGLTVRLLDDSAAVASGATVDVSSNGGTTAASATTVSLSTSVTPVNDAPSGSVTIVGTASQNQILSASDTLADADGLGVISYSWLADGVSFASGSSVSLAQAQVGKAITVVASYTDGQGTAEAVSSAATAAVANVNDAPTGSVTITGTPAQNQVLTANNTLADADGLGTISYRWLADGVSFANGSSVSLAQSQVGKVITVVASYTDGQGTVEAVSSAATGLVANVNELPTGSVTITGTPAQNQVLTASNTLADADGLGTISYRWWADGVSFASGSSVSLAQAQVGKVITVVASYTDGQGTAEAVTSPATAAVSNVNDAPVLGRPVDDQTAAQDIPFAFTVPAGTFTDPDVGDRLSIAATLASGAPLPAWLRFDAATQSFSGTPPLGEPSPVVVQLTATDLAGASAQSLLQIRVLAPPAPAAVESAAPAAKPPAESAAKPPAAVQAAVPPAVPSLGRPLPTLGSVVPLETTSDVPASSTALAVTAPKGDDVLTARPPASRADAVLAAAETPQFINLSAQSANFANSDDMQRKFAELQRQINAASDTRQLLAASSTALAGSVSIGYVVWLVRGGVLVSSMLSALPAWQMIDPLPVLAAARKSRGNAEGDEEPEVERLFGKSKDAGIKPKKPAGGRGTVSASADKPLQPPANE